MRVRWFRDRAERDRWKEELEIVTAEFERVHLFFETMQNAWDTLADSRKHGWRANAKRQSAIYGEWRAKLQEFKDRATRLSNGEKVPDIKRYAP